MITSSANSNESSSALPVAPFWYDLWQASGGWSKRVARVWAKDTAYRTIDRGFLAAVTGTLAPDQKAFVESVLSSEGHA